MTRQEGLRLERLGGRHELASFESGQPDLDGWLRRHGLAAQQADSARTLLLIDGVRVVGYCSLTMSSVRRRDAPGRLVRGLPAYPVGAVLLARLAVSRTDQGPGLGGLLLTEALRKAVAAGQHAAARLVIVDAIDTEAAAFYRHHGFIPAPEHDLRLYRRMKDIAASLDQPVSKRRRT